MAHSDAIAAEVRNSARGPRCSICALLPTLDKDDRAALLAAFDNPDITSAVITRALRGQGHAVREEGLRRHRKGECLRIGA